MFNRKMLYMTHPPQNMHGISLIEVSVVLVILVALAGLGLPYVRSTIDDSECSLTDVTLQNVKSAIMGSPTAPGFVGDMNRMPYNLEELTTCTISTVIPHSCATTTQLTSYNPSSQSGWRGPYVSKVTRNK
jgi:type II secretory pathway pseudopilin PulG